MAMVCLAPGAPRDVLDRPADTAGQVQLGGDLRARLADLLPVRPLLFPACWLVFTLIRGAVIHWYPYPFIDVSVIGYGKAILNSFWVSLLLLGLAAGATALDSRLGPRGPAAGIARAPAGQHDDVAS
jgi:hypothetical protein